MTRIDLLSNPMTTAEDMIVGGASGVPERLAVGSNGDVLTVTAGAVGWAAPVGGGMVGNVLRAVPLGVDFEIVDNTAPSASAGYALIMPVTGPMSVRSAIFHMQAAASGTYQWGLFDYSASATAATKLAGGSGALNSTGWVAIAASGAPVAIDAGNYLFVMLAPAANVGSMYRNPVTANFMGSQGSYAWDDTPDFTSGWNKTSGNLWSVALVGDLDGTNQW